MVDRSDSSSNTNDALWLMVSITQNTIEFVCVCVWAFSCDFVTILQQQQH